MRLIWAIAKKDLLCLFRDRTGLLVILFVPILFAVFFGTMYSDDPNPTIKLAVVDEDQSEASKSYIQGLANDENLDIRTLDLAEADRAVLHEKVLGRIRIEKGFAERFLKPLAPAPPIIDLALDPSRLAEGSVLEGLLTRNAFAQADVPMDLAPIQLKSSDLVQSKTSKAPDAFELSFPQGIVWGLLSVVMAFSTSLVNERTKGTLVRLQTAPIQGSAVLAGKALACFIMNGLISAVLLILGIVGFGIWPTSWVLLGLGLVCISVAMTGIMMLLATFGDNERTTSNIGWTVMLILAMTGGGMLPVYFMSDWLAAASQFSPVKWAVISVEGPLWRGYTFDEMILPCAILLSVGIVAFAAGTQRFRMQE